MENTKRYFIAILLFAGISQNISLASPLEDGLWKAIKNNSYAQAIEYIDQGANPNAPQDEYGTTFLHTLAFGTQLNCEGRKEAVKIAKALFDKGANPNIVKLSSLKSPLHAAVSSNYVSDNFEMIQLLLEKGAKINAADSRGNTALQGAVGNSCQFVNQLKVVTLLLEKGANPNIVNWAKENPLHTVAEESVEPDNPEKAAINMAIKAQIVELLLAYGAKKDTADVYGNTPYMIFKSRFSQSRDCLRDNPQRRSSLEKIRNLLCPKPERMDLNRDSLREYLN